MDSSQDIQFNLDISSGVGHILLNRPRALNALSLDMIRRMTATLKQWESDPGVRMIMVQGEGDRAFCSGGDVKSIAQCRGESFQTDFIREEYELDHLISQLDTPYISVWDGIVMGGGVGISRMGHFRIATERTVFAMPECGIGLIPDVGAGYFLSQLPGHVGLYLGLTGTRVTGADTRVLGLATHYIVSSHVSRVLESLSQLSSVTRDSIDQVLKQHCSEVSTSDIWTQQHIDTINLTFNSATLSQIIQTLQTSQSEFSRETLQKINKCSPTSLSLAFKQLSLSTSTYQEALEIEFRLMSKRFQDPDFYEGVRAALIDKDNKPRWEPDSIDKVNNVDYYFQHQPGDLKL